MTSKPELNIDREQLVGQLRGFALRLAEAEAHIPVGSARVVPEGTDYMGLYDAYEMKIIAERALGTHMPDLLA